MKKPPEGVVFLCLAIGECSRGLKEPEGGSRYRRSQAVLVATLSAPEQLHGCRTSHEANAIERKMFLIGC